ncbi:acyltransferase family protein [Geodermatophilus sp. SYSU D00708]
MESRADTATTRGKDLGIQSLRGVAVILMVAGHVIGSRADLGLTVEDDSGWRFFYRALEDLRMPLFTVLSGYVYAYRPVRAKAGLAPLVKGKVRRLFVPFVVVCTVFFFVQMAVPGTNTRPELSDLPHAFLFGYQHLWFLQSILLIFLLVGALDAFNMLGTFRSWGMVTLATFVLFILVRLPSDIAVFSINGFLRLLPFFLLGYAAHRYSDQLLQPRSLLIATVFFLPVYALRLYTILADVDWPGIPSRALSLAVAVLVVVTLLALRRYLASRFLVWLGGFSFAIYLLHVFGSAGARIVGLRLGIDGTPLLFVLGLVFAIGLPIVFELLFGRFAVISWAVLGQKPRRPAAALSPVETKAPTGDSVS